MFTLPYRTLIEQKCWATNGLHAVLADNFDRLSMDEKEIVRRLALKPEQVDEAISFAAAAQREVAA